MTLKERFTGAIRYFAGGFDATVRDRHQPALRYDRGTYRAEDDLIGTRDRETLRQLCLDARRNNPIVAGICRVFADNVVGAGITPQAKTSDKGWNKASEAYFAEWQKIADARQRVDLFGLQRLVVENRLTAGDMAFQITSGGQLMPIEGERIQTPYDQQTDARKIVDGIAMSDNGVPAAFYVFNRDIYGRIDPSSKDYQVVLANEMFFVPASPYRFDQVRSIPDLTPALVALGYLSRINTATLEKAEMDANMAWAIFDDGETGPGNLGPRGSGNVGVAGAPQNVKLERGEIRHFKIGASMSSFESKTPNQQYKDFRLMNLREVGGAVGLPIEFLLMYFAETNFSASKAALLQAYRTFYVWQLWLSGRFLQRTWNWRIAKAIKAGELGRAPVDARGVSEWYKVDWSYPEADWVDPQSIAQTNLLEWQLGTNTITAMNRKRGLDVEDTFDMKGDEIALAHAKAQDINKATGLNLTWRDIISASIPGQTQALSAPADSTGTGAPQP